MEGDPWAGDDEYVAYLEGERARYAWVLRTYGGLSPAEADASAGERYPYEAPGPYRGLVFHDEAWHWAMLTLKGAEYWRDPELVAPPDAYRALD